VLDFIEKNLQRSDVLRQLEDATRSELYAAAVGLPSHADIAKMRVIPAIETAVANVELFLRSMPRTSWAVLRELLQASKLQQRDGELYLWIDEEEELKLEDGRRYGAWDW
jgi:hypothetical protein